MRKKSLILGIVISFCISILFAQTIPVEIDTVLSDFVVNEDIGRCNHIKPSVSIAEDGTFIISWFDYRNFSINIYAQRFDASGKSIGSNMKINTIADIVSFGKPSIATKSNDSYLITWTGNWTVNKIWNMNIFLQNFDIDGLPIDSSVLVNDDGIGDQYISSIAILPNNSYVITWIDNRNWHYDIYAQLYNSLGNTIGSNFMVNDDDGSTYQYSPVITSLKDSTFIITWTDERNGNPDIYAQHFNAMGDTIGPNILINDDEGNSIQSSPAITALNDGYIISWEDERNGNSDIYFQHMNAMDNLIGTNMLVNDDIENSNQSNASVSADDVGNFIITWEDERNGNSDIYSQYYNSSGNKIGDNIKINDDGGNNNQFLPIIDMHDNGSYVITWEDERNGNTDIYAQYYDATTCVLTSNIMINDDIGSSNQLYPKIAVSSAGSHVITWVDDRNGNDDIYAQRFNLIGDSIGPNILINDDEGNNGQTQPSIAMSNDGSYVITWVDNRNGYGDIYAQHFNAMGDTIGPNILINDDEGNNWQTQPSIAMSDNGFYIITWEDLRNGHRKIYAQCFNVLGDTVGTNTLVSDDIGVSYYYSGPSIAMNNDSSYVITWADERNGNLDIYAQCFNSLGDIVGTNTLINDDVGNNDQFSPSIAMSDNGSYIITWTDKRNGNWDIYAQCFNSLGDIVGTNTLINDDVGNNDQFSPSIAMSDNGSYIILWEDRRNNNTKIYAQLFDDSGNALGNNFPISKISKYYNNSSTNYPPSAGLINSTIYTTWHENKFPGKRYDIFYNILEYSITSSISPEDVDYTLLNDNYPNPFNPTTTLQYSLPEASDVNLMIFDITGRKIKEWSVGNQQAGWHEVVWNGTNQNGNVVSTGVYIYRLRAGDFVDTKKMVFMK